MDARGRVSPLVPVFRGIGSDHFVSATEPELSQATNFTLGWDGRVDVTQGAASSPAGMSP